MFVSCVTVCGWGGGVVCGDGEVKSRNGWCWGGGAYGCLCDGSWWGESGRVGCIRSRV